jgi:hypothetical protein
MAMVKPAGKVKNEFRVQGSGFGVQGSGASRAPVIRSNRRKDGNESWVFKVP